MEANKDMKGNVEMLPIDREQDVVKEEQEEVIAELEEVLHFLKTKQIKNKESLAIIKKPLDDLRSCLKYLPTESCFDFLPNEITKNILSFLSDSNAVIAAAVCTKWEGLLRDRFTEKAVLFFVKVAAPKMDVNVYICDSVEIVDAKLVTQGQTSFKQFSLVEEMRREECDLNPLWIDKLQDLFRGLDDVTLRVEMKQEDLNLSEINQDRLINFLVNRVDDFIMDGVNHTNIKLIKKLALEPSEIKLKLLTLSRLSETPLLSRFEWPDELNFELANALCNVENVSIHYDTFLKKETVKQLLENILTSPVKIKTLRVYRRFPYVDLINPEDLKKLFNKMTSLILEGYFTSEQTEAARSLPGVRVFVRFGGFQINKS